MGEKLQGIKGYNDVEINTGNKPKEPIPGVYILKIMNAKVEEYSGGKIAIKLAFDIAEGEFKDYYSKLYLYNKSGKYSENAKYKGTINLWYPDSSKENPDDYKKSLANFKRAITAINDSNSGRKIDPENGIDIDIFKGKAVGGAFGLVDWSYNGKSGTRCECRWLVGTDRVKNGEVEAPKHKTLSGYAASYTSNENVGVSGDLGDFEEILSDGEMPF